MAKEDMTGLPPNGYWFCADHLEIAKEHESLTTNEALEKIEQSKLDSKGTSNH